MNQGLRIFVCYAHDDKAQVKDWIVEPLKATYNIWYDDAIPGGAKWRQSIDQEIAACDVFLYVLSPESVKSRYCRAEFEQAQKRDKVVLPVLLQNGTKIPAAVSENQYVDFRDGKTPDNIRNLLDALVKIERERSITKTPNDDTTMPPVLPRRKPDWNIVIGVVGLILAVVGLLVSLPPQTEQVETNTPPPPLTSPPSTTPTLAPTATPTLIPTPRREPLQFPVRNCDTALNSALLDVTEQLTTDGITMRFIGDDAVGVSISLECQRDGASTDGFRLTLDGIIGDTPDGDAISIIWMQPISFRLWAVLLEPPRSITLAWTHDERIDDLAHVAYALSAYYNARTTTALDPLRLAIERLDGLSESLRDARDPFVCLLEGNLHLRRALRLDFGNTQLQTRIRGSLNDAANAYAACLSSADEGEPYTAALANNAGIVGFLVLDFEEALQYFQEADFSETVVNYARLNRSMVYASRTDEATANALCPDTPVYSLESLCRAQPLYVIASMDNNAMVLNQLISEINDASGGIRLGIESPPLDFYRGAAALCGNSSLDASSALNDAAAAAERQPVVDPVFEALLDAHFNSLTDRAICDPFGPGPQM